MVTNMLAESWKDLRSKFIISDGDVGYDDRFRVRTPHNVLVEADTVIVSPFATIVVELENRDFFTQNPEGAMFLFDEDVAAVADYSTETRHIIREWNFSR